MRGFVFGSFNPITLAHIEIGNLVRSKMQCDEVIYVPASRAYIKSYKGYEDRDILSDDERMCLLTESLKPYGYKVCPLELTGELSGKTYDTLDYYGWEDGVVLCVGLDNLLGLPTWYRGEELLRKCTLMIMCSERSVTTPEEIAVMRKAKGSTLVLSRAFKDVRSTTIREACRRRDLDMVKHMVPSCVYQYLKENENVFV